MFFVNKVENMCVFVFDKCVYENFIFYNGNSDEEQYQIYSIFRYFVNILMKIWKYVVILY